MIPEYDGWHAVPAHLYTRTQLADLDLPRVPGRPVRAYVTAPGTVYRRETFDLYDITESDPSPATGRQLEAAAARRTRSAYRCADCGAHTERPAIHTRDGDPPAYRSLCLACRHIADLRAFQTRLAALRADAAERAAHWVALDTAAVLHITVHTPQPTESGRRRPPVAVSVDAVTPSGAELFSHALRLRRSHHHLVPAGAADWDDALPVLRKALDDRHLIVWTAGYLDPIVPALLPESATPAQLACYRRERTVSELSAPVAQWRGELDPDTGTLRPARHPGRADLLALLIRRIAADHPGASARASR